MLTIHEIAKDAIDEFKNYLKEGEYTSEDDIYDLIHEIADGHVPIYYSQVLEVAMSNLRLAKTRPEL